MKHTGVRLVMALMSGTMVMMVMTTMMVVGQEQKHPAQLQQRPPEQLGGQLLPPERPHVQHQHPHLRPRSADDDDHALRLLARAATGLAACWNATAPAPPTHLTFGPGGRCCTFKLGCVGNLWDMACPECEPETSHVKLQWYPHSHHRDGVVVADLSFRLPRHHQPPSQHHQRCHGRVEVAFTGDPKAVVTLTSPIRCSRSSDLLVDNACLRLFILF